jgi:hypothetical protein
MAYSDNEKIPGSDFLFRHLTNEEEVKFRQWARENYVKYSEINPIWHPVVRDECEKINSGIQSVQSDLLVRPVQSSMKCPLCGATINDLAYEEETLVLGRAEYGEDKESMVYDEQEQQSKEVLFRCPKCFEKLFEDEDSAQKWLLGDKDAYQKIID